MPGMSENAFGILSHRFGCFLTTIHQHPDTIILITMCVCVLHNFILIRYPHANSCADSKDPDTHDLIPSRWRTDRHLQGLLPLTSHHTKKDAEPFTLPHLPCWCCPLARKISSSSIRKLQVSMIWSSWALLCGWPPPLFFVIFPTLVLMFS